MTTIPLPEPINHIEAVRALLAEVRSVRERIVGFEHNRPSERSRLNLNAGTSDQFLESCATAIEASPPLAATARTQPAILRDVIIFSQAYTSLADELELTARGLRYTIARRRAEAAQMALQTYAIAKSLNRPPEREVLVPHIQAMKRAFKRKRKRKPPIEAPQPLTPAPAPPIEGGAA